MNNIPEPNRPTRKVTFSKPFLIGAVAALLSTGALFAFIAATRHLGELLFSQASRVSGVQIFILDAGQFINRHIYFLVPTSVALSFGFAWLWGTKGRDVEGRRMTQAQRELPTNHMKPTEPDHSTTIVVGCVALTLGVFLFVQYANSGKTPPPGQKRIFGERPPAPAPPREPVHDGRRLSEWLVDLYPAARLGNKSYAFLEGVETGTPEEAKSRTLTYFANVDGLTAEQNAELAKEAARYAAACGALRQVGSNALPYLVHSAHYYDWKRDRSSDIQRSLQTAFRILGTNAAPALPGLFTAQDTSRLSSMIPLMMAGVGPPSVPTLIRCLGHTNASVRAAAADGLGNIHGQTSYDLGRKARARAILEGREIYRPDQWDTVPTEWRPTNSIPALTPLLQDTNRTSIGNTVARSAAFTMARFGQPSEVWVPALLAAEADVQQTASTYWFFAQPAGRGAPERIARLRQDMESGHAEIRFVAAYATSESVTQELEPLMLKVLEQAATGTNSSFAKAASDRLAKLRQSNGAK